MESLRTLTPDKMPDRLNMTVGLLAMAAAFVVIPASIALVRDSVRERQAIAALRVPQTFEIHGSHILDPALYDTRREAAESSQKGL